LIFFCFIDLCQCSIWAYPVDIYRVIAMSQAPLIHDVKRSTSVLQSVRHTLAQGDTIRDTVDAFGPRSVREKQQRLQQQKDAAIALDEVPITTDDEAHDFGDVPSNSLGLADDSDKVSVDARR
jgi:hypothetical protein